MIAGTFVGVGSTGVASAVTVAAPIDLGTLGGTSGLAMAASSTVIAGNSYVAGDAAYHAFAYDLTDPAPHMIDLGTLGGTWSAAQAVSGRVVLGYSETETHAIHSFVYELDDPSPHIVDIGTLGGDTQAAGISGSVVVGFSFFGVNQYHAVLYDLADPNPHLVSLGTLGGTWSGAQGISGSVIVGTSETAAGEQHAFVYDLADPSPHMVDIGTLGGNYAQAIAVDGHLVAGISNTSLDWRNSELHAFAYDLAAPTPHMIDLGTLGTSNVSVYGVRGNVISGFGTTPSSNAGHGWVYDLGAASPHMVDIGTFGGQESQILGMSNNLVVGFSSDLVAYHAFAYDFTALSPHLIELGTFGGANGYAYGVTDGGLILGQAQNANGEYRAAMWQTTPSVDETGPAITVTAPVNGGEFTRGQVVNASYACDDGIDGSGVASCTGSVASGTAIDTATAGQHPFTVDATDGAGNASSTSVSYTVRAGDVSRNVSGGETVSTDPGGLGASPAIPIQTQIVVPGGVSGQITVAPQAAGSPPVGYSFFGAAVAVTGPAATSATDPYVATFTVDGSLLGSIDVQDLQVFRNGAPVLDCTDPSAAIPDPCVVERSTVGGSSDDVLITVRTTQFSTWTVGQRAFSVTHIQPSSASRGALHASIEIVGTGFVAGSTATIPGGGVTVSSTTFVDASHLTADIAITNGAALGARNVQVRRPGPPVTTSICTGCFTVNPKPTITALSPAALPQGASFRYVEMTGTDFANGASVTFGGTGVSLNQVFGEGTSLYLYVSVSPTAAKGARSVTVTNPDGSFVTKNNALTINAKPTATAVTPGSAPLGKTLNVQIIGSGFPANFVAAGGTVSFFNPSVTVNTVTRNSASKLTANITVAAWASAGPRDVSVTNPDGGSALCASCFLVTPLPVISSVFPASRAQGTNTGVNVSGSGFQVGATASIPGGGVTVTSVQRNAASSLTLAVNITGGAAPTARNVIVTNPDGGTVTCSGCFTVNPKPTVSGTTPNSRKAGASYTIAVNGTGLQDGASVQFSGTGIQATSVSGSGSSLSVDITIAADATLGNRTVTVTNPDGGSATKANAFKVLAP